MSELLKSAGKIGSTFSKISEIVGEVGGWMSVLGIRHRGGGESHQEAGLKASMMGIGEKDEALFWSAVALAQQKGWIKEDGLKNLSAVFSRLNHAERGRLYKIIGQDEQSVVIEMHSKTDATTAKSELAKRRRGSEEKKDGETKEPIEKTTATGNVRGAMTVALLADMPPDEAVTFLRNSGTLSGPLEDLGYAHEKLCEFLEKTGGGKTLRKRMRAITLGYLGAKTFKEARANVEVKEDALRKRQAQSWIKRDLTKRPVFSSALVILVVFSAVSFWYVFSH